MRSAPACSADSTSASPTSDGQLAAPTPPPNTENPIPKTAGSVAPRATLAAHFGDWRRSDVTGEPVVEQCGQLDRAVALHAVSGTVHDMQLQVGLPASGLGDIGVVDDR